MTDKELLVLAAKAAGIEIVDGEHGEIVRVYYTDPNNGLSRFTNWNPLTDDGDALRLAVKLEMDIDVCFASESTWTMSGYDDGCGISEQHNGDPYAATRRAIVRAAAELGRNME